MVVEVKPIKVFSREEPCTKIDLFNCFRRGGKYVPRPVVETRGEIGENSPKYMLREGYARMLAQRGIDYLVLTEKGEAWLTRGVRRYVEIHPAEAEKLEQPLPAQHTVKVVVRRARRA